VKYAYLIGSAAAMLIWLTCWFHADVNRRTVILRVSAITGVWGLTQPLFVPVYWSPPSLFDLNRKIVFDIESVMFMFAAGGIAAAIYTGLRTIRLPGELGRHDSRQFERFALAVPPVVFVVLAVTTNLNPIYIAIVALLTGAAAGCWCRPDLTRVMFASGILFLSLYFAFFLTFNAVFPGYIVEVWNLKAVSGVIVAGVPLEELLFAFSYGFTLSSVAEYVSASIENQSTATASTMLRRAARSAGGSAPRRQQASAPSPMAIIAGWAR
jgi:hypothetical protein